MPLWWMAACGGLTETKTATEPVEEGSSVVDVLGIVVTPNEVIVPVGSSVQLEALGLNDERETIELTDAVDWISGSPSVATISNGLSEEGTLSGLQAGTTMVYANFDGVQSAPSKITVTEADLVRLSITPPSVTLAVGDSVQLSAEASFSDGTSSDASGQVRWITANGSVAVLNGDGVLEGAGVGSTEVHVEWKDVDSDPIAVEVVDEVTSVDADLVVSSLFGSLGDGELTVMVDIENQGSAPVADFWVDLFIDPIAEPTSGDWPDVYQMVDYLGAGESTTVTFTRTSTASSHMFTVIVDPLNAIAESNESNNSENGSVASGGSHGGSDDPDELPNLTFSYVGGTSSGTETEFWVDVTNDGPVPVDSFYLDVFFNRSETDEPGVFDAGDAWKFIDGLGAYETVYTSVVVEDSCTDCGSWLMLDGFDLNVESSESDNTLYFRLGDAWIRPAAPK
jgi:hypothetical protein